MEECWKNILNKYLHNLTPHRPCAIFVMDVNQEVPRWNYKNTYFVISNCRAFSVSRALYMSIKQKIVFITLTEQIWGWNKNCQIFCDFYVTAPERINSKMLISRGLNTVKLLKTISQNNNAIKQSVRNSGHEYVDIIPNFTPKNYFSFLVFITELV